MLDKPGANKLGFNELVEAFRRHIGQLPGCTNAVYDAPTRTIRYDHNGKTYTVNPVNTYADYLKDGGDLASFLQARCAALLSNQAPRPQSLSEAAPNLLPMVRDRRYLDIALLMARVSAKQTSVEVEGFPFRTLAGELVVTLALDSATSSSIITKSELASWGVSFDAAYDVALGNLRARTQSGLDQVSPGLYLSRWADAYDASRLLLPELWAGLKLRGEPVVCVPSRSLMVVAGSDDPTALSALAALSAKVLRQESRPLSADVLHCRGQSWREAAASISQHPSLLRARHELMQRDYNQQAELLNTLNKAQGRDIFIASYQLGAKDENAPYTNYTQVTEGVSQTLLPRADQLAFLTRTQELLLVPWAEAEALLGPALKRLAIHPLRYRYAGFPDSALLALIRAKAVIAQGPADPKQRMAAAAENFRLAYQGEFQRELAYNAAGVDQMDQLIEDQRSQGVVATWAFVEGIGAFVGEVLVRQFGGEWIVNKDRFCVRLDSKAGVFPLDKVDKQWANGRGVDSVRATYESVKQLRLAQPPGAAVVPAAQASARHASGQSQPQLPIDYAHRIPPQAADPKMEQALTQARDKFARLRKAAAVGTLDAMHAQSPKWLTHRDPLSEVERQQSLLLKEGQIVWGALVMANNLMFKPGREDCPGLLVYSLDPWFEARPHELHAIARRIFELKQTEPADPDLRALAKLVTEETDRGMGWSVPAALTDRDVRGAIFMAFRKHLPLGVMHGEKFPILLHSSTQAVMMLPFEGWPAELVRAWRPGGDARSLEEIRALPKGIRVTHTPAVVAAVKGGQDGRQFIWSFQTSVEATDAELSIVEFGAFSLVDGQWQLTNRDESPFAPPQFAEWYACPDARLAPAKPATDPKNWNRSNQLRSSRSLWYFIGKNRDGKLFYGEGELDLRGTLIAPDSVPLKPTKGPGGLAAITRLFGKNKAQDLLRFDGVYRVLHRSQAQADTLHGYLRFYPDGGAVYGDSAQDPSELAKWFNIQSPDLPAGYYKTHGQTVRIEIAAGHNSLVFSGGIERNALTLSYSRYPGGPMLSGEFLFMGWRP